MFAVATPATLGRRACAVLAASSAALHAFMLTHAANPAMAVLMVVMVVGCLYCARDLWLRGTLRTWCVVALMNLAMIALHLPAPVHHHVAGAATAQQQSTIMALATGLSLAEVGLAAGVLWFRTRRQPTSVRYHSTRSP
ncbi:hypothetical protein [Mycobacterium sp.]|uniref:hypothetical protein n=1 Tax=Mycobacterium sp. TaxID=1785 RepID=UPI002D9A8FFB|nr:hypothetical protein [Mycobacterium sp.]